MRFGLFLWALAAALDPLGAGAQEQGLVIQDVQCRGNTSTTCPFIKENLHLAAGDAVDEDELLNAKLRLAALPNFKFVEVKLEKGGEKGRAIVVIEVAEASAITKEFAFGTKAHYGKTERWVSKHTDASQRLAGRLIHQNIFGTGKILDLEVVGRLPISGPRKKGISAKLRYVDPHLLGARRFFLFGALSHQRDLQTSSDDFSVEARQWGTDLSVGFRFGDFSYFSFGNYYRPSRKTIYKRDSRVLLEVDDNKQMAWVLSYGWNSEDDPYFPTQGSRFNASFSRVVEEELDYYRILNLGLSYRAIWAIGEGIYIGAKIAGSATKIEKGHYWNVDMGGGTGATQYRQTLDEELGLSFSFEKDIAPGRLTKRGRWYVGPGIAPSYSTWDWAILPALKVGVRLESETFGVVDLYAIGSATWLEGRRW